MREPGGRHVIAEGLSRRPCCSSRSSPSTEVMTGGTTGASSRSRRWRTPGRARHHRHAAERPDQRRRLVPDDRRQHRVRHGRVHQRRVRRVACGHQRDSSVQHPRLQPDDRRTDHLLGADAQRAGQDHHLVTRRQAHLRRRRVHAGQRREQVPHRRARPDHRRLDHALRACRRLPRQRAGRHQHDGLHGRQVQLRQRQRGPRRPRRVHRLERRPAELGPDRRRRGQDDGDVAGRHQADRRRASSRT